MREADAFVDNFNVIVTLTLLLVCHDELRQKNPVAGFPSCRLVLAAMGFFAFFNCYTLRINLSVAIVAMVNATYLRELEAASDSDNETSGARWSCDDSDGRTAQKSNATNIHQVRLL